MENIKQNLHAGTGWLCRFWGTDTLHRYICQFFKYNILFIKANTKKLPQVKGSIPDYVYISDYIWIPICKIATFRSLLLCFAWLVNVSTTVCFSAISGNDMEANVLSASSPQQALKTYKCFHQCKCLVGANWTYFCSRYCKKHICKCAYLREGGKDWNNLCVLFLKIIMMNPAISYEDWKQEHIASRVIFKTQRFPAVSVSCL